MVDDDWTKVNVGTPDKIGDPVLNNTDLPMYFIINAHGGDFDLKVGETTLVKRTDGGRPFTYDTRTGILYD